MKIAIGSDHADFRYKEKIKEMLKRPGHEIVDFGGRHTHRIYLIDHPEAAAKS